jgi:hypothetical protein
MPLKDMRDELRELRKTTGMRPISKMKKEDISREIERLKVGRETTPAVAAVPSAPLKKSKSAVESIKEAKRAEFPVMPEDAKKTYKKTDMGAGKRGAVAAGAGEKKKSGASKKDMLVKLMAMMESDDE